MAGAYLWACSQARPRPRSYTLASPPLSTHLRASTTAAAPHHCSLLLPTILPLRPSAVTHFRNAKAYRQLIRVADKAAKANIHLETFHTAAKMFEMAAQACLDLYKDLSGAEDADQQIPRAADFYREAALKFRENEAEEMAGETLMRGAKNIVADDPALARELAMEAIEMLESNEDKLMYCIEPMRGAIGVFLKMQAPDDAIAIARRLIVVLQAIDAETLSNKMTMTYKFVFGIIIMHLHQKRFGDADKEFNDAMQYDGFPASSDAQAAEALLQALRGVDDESFAKACKQQYIAVGLDKEIANLGRKLKFWEVSQAEANAGTVKLQDLLDGKTDGEAGEPGSGAGADAEDDDFC